jgi:hypothetical protein
VEAVHAGALPETADAVAAGSGGGTGYQKCGWGQQYQNSNQGAGA